MYDDVSVTRLSDEDRWNDRVPPGPRSRLRVLAVMGAVVVGCGVAAFVVATEDGDAPAPDPDDAVVIAMPTRTSGISGPDTTPTREITYSPTTMGSSEPETSDEATTTTGETTTTTTERTTTTEPEPEPTVEDPADPSSPAEPPPPPPPSSPSAPTTTQPDDCWFWLFC